MAITEVAEYAHLRAAEVDALGEALEAIRGEVEDSRGSGDRAYILRAVALQRRLEVIARLVIAASGSRAGWVAGSIVLAVAKSIENMELGHNISHGQWDWMNDPEIHSTTWEWDMVGPSSHWRYSHNYRHHVFTNVVGMDDDLGYDDVLRVTRDQQWRLGHLLQPLRNLFLALTFEWGIAAHDLYAEHKRAVTRAEKHAHTTALLRKIGRQAAKDYLLFPAMSGRRWRRTLAANCTANMLRNLWAYVVIFSGHFADGAEKFTPAALEGESKPDWYLRQMLGSANFNAGPVMSFMSGHLCYHIEHHLYPDLPSNRYPEISRRVRALCETYDLPYTTRPLAHQYMLTLRTICKLALPDRLLTATSDDAPETASEVRFRGSTAQLDRCDVDNGVTMRSGLATALQDRSRRHRLPGTPDRSLR